MMHVGSSWRSLVLLRKTLCDRCVYIALQWLNILIIVFILLGTQVDLKLAAFDNQFFGKKFKQFHLPDLEKEVESFIVGYQQLPPMYKTLTWHVWPEIPKRW